MELLSRLIQNEVEFFIVGGVAAIAHGSPRLTEDLDICASLSHGNAVRIIKALAGVNPKWRDRPDMPIIKPDNPNLIGLKNLYVRTTLGQLDVLGELVGVGTYEQLRERTVEVDYHGIRCRVVDLDTLIDVKRAAGRPKDLLDLKTLELIRKMLREREERGK